MADKDFQYQELVKYRKKCQLCQPELVNPQFVNYEYDCDEIGAWSQWYGSLDAKIMLVGQDWGTIKYFNENLGKDEPDNKTMQNLIKLFKSIDIVIEKPYSKKNDLLFFTNTVLCLKDDERMNKPVKLSHCLKCANLFLKPLVDLICPTIIIALGKPAFITLCTMYGLKEHSQKKSIELVKIPTGIPVPHNITIFPVFHCSPLGCANRNLNDQITDWKKIREKMIEEKNIKNITQ
jgi:uracil-DNA glycosylase